MAGIIAAAALATSVKTQTLEAAASIVGGPSKLREALQVPGASLLAWLAGREEPPKEVFLRALDILLDDVDRNYPLGKAEGDAESAVILKLPVPKP